MAVAVHQLYGERMQSWMEGVQKQLKSFVEGGRARPGDAVIMRYVADADGRDLFVCIVACALYDDHLRDDLPRLASWFSGHPKRRLRYEAGRLAAWLTSGLRWTDIRGQLESRAARRSRLRVARLLLGFWFTPRAHRVATAAARQLAPHVARSLQADLEKLHAKESGRARERIEDLQRRTCPHSGRITIEE